MTGILFCVSLMTSTVLPSSLYESNYVLLNDGYISDGVYYDTILTPNNSSVNVHAYIDDFTPSEKESINNEYILRYPYCEYLSSATTNYNCHSYTFYSQDTIRNGYCIENPTPFLNDGTYVESDGQVGDIVCYWFDGNLFHSGIIVDIIDGVPDLLWNSLNLKIIESKWGAAPLFRHRGDDCPYVENFLEEEFKTDLTISYYSYHGKHEYEHLHSSVNEIEHNSYCSCERFVTNEHNFSYILSRVPSNHVKKCDDCNYLVEESHAVSYADFTDGDNWVYCVGCGKKLNKNDGLFMVNGYNNKRSINGSSLLPNGLIILVDSDVESYLAGTLVFYDTDNELI